TAGWSGRWAGCCTRACPGVARRAQRWCLRRRARPEGPEMRAVLVLVLVVLIGGDILGVEPGLAPGLSLKNAALYLGFGLLLLQRGVTGRPQVQLGWLQGLFLCMVVYAIGTIVFNAILLDTPRHELLEQAIGIKTQLVDRLIMF